MSKSQEQMINDMLMGDRRRSTTTTTSQSSTLHDEINGLHKSSKLNNLHDDTIKLNNNDHDDKRKKCVDDEHVYCDRFIPSQRQLIDDSLTSDFQKMKVSMEIENIALSKKIDPGYTLLLQRDLLDVDTIGSISLDKHTQFEQLKKQKKRNVFSFITDQMEKKDKLIHDIFIDKENSYLSNSHTKKLPRKIAGSPFKVLDAPLLQDDFYLNLVDWSSQNILAVGLGNSVYLWSPCTSAVTKLCDFGNNNIVCSVAWSQRGKYLSVGTLKGDIQIWDIDHLMNIRVFHGHCQRVGTMTWHSSFLSSGSRDRSILHHDIRVKDDYFCKQGGHRSEICGLKWSPDDRQLSSGGNDNQLMIWEMNSKHPLLRFKEHTAAIKAISWSPHKHGLLASGGGTADRCIRFWNTVTGKGLNCIDTGSQVCSLSWSKNVDEIVSTHGFSQNQILVWKYPEMTKLATLTGHTMRVLYLSISPNGQTIVTGAGDETLRFWNVFPGMNTVDSVKNWSMIYSRSHLR